MNTKNHTSYIFVGVVILALTITAIFFWNNYQISIIPKNLETYCSSFGEVCSQESQDRNLCEVCGIAISTSYASCHSKEFCNNRPSVSQPNMDTCGIENCHGLDIVCGKNPAQMCTEMYQLGDRCRQFASCSKVKGKCQLVDNPQFTNCKVCALQCEKQYPNDPEQALFCESQCGE